MKYYEDGQWKDVQIKVANAIQNEYGESNNDGYSQNYLNDKLVNVGTEVDSRSRVNVLHSKNLLPNNGSTITTNGITFTKNSDGSITINGTSTARADLYIFGGTTDNGNYLKIKKGTYSFDRSNLTDGKIFFAFREKTSGTKYETITNNGAIEAMATQDCYFYGVMIGVESGNTINNLTIYPMLNEGNTLLPYEPYVVPSIYVDGENIYSKSISEYSTSEIRVGTWLGKPLYRKVFYITSNLSSPLDIVHGISNIEYIKVEGQLTTSTTSTPPFYNSSTDFFRVFRNGAYLSTRYGSGISATSITFIVEYTKTTDTVQTRNLQTISIPENDDEGEIVRGEEE